MAASNDGLECMIAPLMNLLLDTQLSIDLKVSVIEPAYLGILKQ